MTDAEVLCSFMEPKPPQSFSAGSQAHPSEYGWWRPGDLTLDALHEVETRLTDEQWREYDVTLASVMFSDSCDPDYLWHATAEQKLKALAAVLRADVAR